MAAAEYNLPPLEELKRLAALCERHATNLSAQNIVSVLSQLSSQWRLLISQSGGSASQWAERLSTVWHVLPTIADCALQCLGNFSPAALCRVLGAFGKLGVHPGDMLVAGLEQRILRAPPPVELADLAELLLAYSQLRILMSGEMCNQMKTLILQSCAPEGSSSHGIPEVIWSLGLIGKPLASVELIGELQKKAVSFVNKFSSKQVTLVMRAFALMDHSISPQLERGIVGRAGERGCAV